MSIYFGSVQIYPITISIRFSGQQISESDHTRAKRTLISHLPNSFQRIDSIESIKRFLNIYNKFKTIKLFFQHIGLVLQTIFNSGFVRFTFSIFQSYFSNIFSTLFSFDLSLAECVSLACIFRHHIINIIVEVNEIFLVKIESFSINWYDW